MFSLRCGIQSFVLKDMKMKGEQWKLVVGTRLGTRGLNIVTVYYIQAWYAKTKSSIIKLIYANYF